jgi:hypothetical protein
MPASSRATVAIILCLTAVGATACTSDKSTGPSLLDINPGLPTGWSIVGTNSPTYVVGTDRVTVHGGQTALAIAGTDTARVRFSGVGQFIKADNYLGKRVRLSAWVRHANVLGTDIGLWMRIDGPGVTQGFDNFSSRPLIGTADWRQVNIILDVPSDAIGIAFGALMSGRGDFLIDDMQFEVIPATGLTTNLLTGFTDSGVDGPTEIAFYSARAKSPANLDFESR